MNKGLVLALVAGLVVLSGCSRFQRIDADKPADTSVSSSSYSQQAASSTDNYYTQTPPARQSYADYSVKETSISTPTHKQIQMALRNAGYDVGTIDGKIGKRTRAAIKDFQKANGLVADGKVGKKTWAVLGSYLDQKIK